MPTAGLVLLGVLAILWGGNWPAMKLGLRELDPWTFRAICLVGGGVGLLALARAAGHGLRVPRGEWRPLLVVTLFNITGWHLLSAYALTLIGAGRAAIIAYTMPLWTVLLARVILAERLTRPRLAGLGLGLAGLGVLIGPDLAIAWRAPLGAGFMLAAAASWAVGTVLLKRYRWSMPTVLLTGWQIVLGGVPAVAGQAVFGAAPALSALSLGAVLGTAYATLIGVIVCHYVWFRVVRMLPSGVAALGTLAVPVVGVLASGWVLGEPIGLREVAALGLVVPALGLVLLTPAPEA